jgi:hypothetical protein
MSRGVHPSPRAVRIQEGESNMQVNIWPISSGMAGMFLCLLTGAACIAPAQTNEVTATAALRDEVQKLKRELLLHRAELIVWKMQSIAAELRQVQSERQRLSSERQLIEREIGELNLASTNEPGSEDEGRREELNTVQLPALLAGERAATVRETTLAGALGAESTRMAEVRKQLQPMAPEPEPGRHK